MECVDFVLLQDVLMQYFGNFFPPSVISMSFIPDLWDQTILHVPERCGSAYKSSDWGSYFMNIVEMD